MDLLPPETLKLIQKMEEELRRQAQDEEEEEDEDLPREKPKPKSKKRKARERAKAKAKANKARQDLNGNNIGEVISSSQVNEYETQIKNDFWPLDCIKCNTLLGNLDNFNMHMNDHWSEDKCCPVCGLLINSKRFNFKQHLKIHTGEKPFTCPTCNRSFRQKAHMVKHVTTHRTGGPVTNGSTTTAVQVN